MSYIESREHFLNYLKKTVKSNIDVLDQSQILSIDFYFDNIYDRGLADEYTWALRNDQVGAKLLEENSVLEWLRAGQEKGLDLKECDFVHRLTSEFIELTEKLVRKPGVYSFWREDELPLYVGCSTSNLGQRMVSSFQRFASYDRPIFERHIVAPTASDAALLEVHFITTLKPAFNIQNKFANDELSLIIPNLPDWSDLVRCNTILFTDPESGEQHRG